MKGRVYVRVSWEVLAAMMKGHAVQAITSNLPADAEVEHVILDDFRREARVYLTSEAFEPVAETMLIPEFAVELTRHFPASVQWGEGSRMAGRTA